MKILPINICNISPNLFTSNAQDTRVSFGTKILNNDIFEHQNKTTLQKAYSKLNKITKEEYLSLTEEEKTALKSANNELPKTGRLPMDNDVKYHNFAANTIKAVFDKQFGKDNYVVISIGRSLSSIAKALEFKIGKENVKSIPLSAVGEFYVSCDDYDEYQNSIKSMTELDGFEIFKKYLKKIGLDKNTIENSNKNYIIMDFAASGYSLNGAYTILTSNELLGNKKRNITVADIYDITKLTEDIGHDIVNDKLYGSDYKKYSFVDHLYTNIEDVEKAADYTKFSKDKEIELKKLFGFMLLDNEYSSEKTNENNIEIHPIDKSMPMQNAKIWNSPKKQYRTDIREDMQEIFKIFSVLKEKVENSKNEGEAFTPESQKLIWDYFTVENLIEEIPVKYMYGNPIASYYTKFRPELLKTLDALTKKHIEENPQN